MNKKLPMLFVVGAILGIVYMFLCVFAREIETYVTFPVLYQKDRNAIQADLELPYESIRFNSDDGNVIDGMYIPYEGAEKTVYYFHGNGGPLPKFYDHIRYIHSFGYNVMSYNYPSYGASSGFPYKERIDMFSENFYNFIKKEKGLDDKNLIIWGYSIGSAVATDFASKHDFSKLVLVAPFSSRYDMAVQRLGFPLQKYLFLKNSYTTMDLIEFISKPLIVIHGKNDQVIEFQQGKKVYENHNGEKYFIELPDAGHNDIIVSYGQSIQNTIDKFLDDQNPDPYTRIDDKQKSILEEKQKIRNEILNGDFESDDSLTKYVDNKIPFAEKEYIPESLSKIASDYIEDTKGGRQLLRQEAVQALEVLGSEFYREFGMKMKVISAYRSYRYQNGIKKRGCPDHLCAKAGFSEHQSGLAVDFWEATTNEQFLSQPTLQKYFLWMQDHAHLYGFHNPYQNGVEIDGYAIEPWHWRYLGIPLASYLKEHNLSFAQFYYGHFINE